MCTLVINAGKAELCVYLFPFISFRRKKRATLTSVAAANDVRKVGESFIAVVPLAAAEEDLRVFLHGDTLLPKSEQHTPTPHEHSDICCAGTLTCTRFDIGCRRWCKRSFGASAAGQQMRSSRWGTLYKPAEASFPPCTTKLKSSGSRRQQPLHSISPNTFFTFMWDHHESVTL